jgi:dihydrofolate reductase
MVKLIYSMIMSLDQYVEDADGRLDWGTPDEKVHSYVNKLARSVGTYLYGRKMYETMIYWEAAHRVPGQPTFVLEWARQWQAADKIVYSRSLTEPRSARTKIEREFEPEVVRRLKASSRNDMTIDGPEIAAHALRAGLVDEIQMIVSPVIVGGGKRFFPDGIRLDLELVEERRLAAASWFGGTPYKADRSISRTAKPY